MFQQMLTEKEELMMQDCTELIRRLFIVIIRGVPIQQCNPVSALGFLSFIPNLTIEEIETFTNGSIRLITPDPFIVERLAPLRLIMSNPSLRIRMVKLDLYDNNVQYCVVMKIPVGEASVYDIEAYMNNNSMEFVRAWRITSWATKQRGDLIKILTASRETARSLMMDGILINDCRYYAWPSKKHHLHFHHY